MVFNSDSSYSYTVAKVLFNPNAYWMNFHFLLLAIYRR